MKIDIITLFPSMFAGPFSTSMLKKAQDKKLVKINFVDLRKFGVGRHSQVDDTPYGGGDGMLLRVDVVVKAIKNTKSRNSKVILLTPQGKTYSQQMAKKLSEEKHLVLVAGHYEGFDERIRDYVDMELSIGNYVLTGGEIPAMVLTDSIVRLIPGVLGGQNSAIEESHSEPGVLEYPQYTKPEVYRGKRVPTILLSGNHGKIATWRKQKTADRNKK